MAVESFEVVRESLGVAGRELPDGGECVGERWSGSEGAAVGQGQEVLHRPFDDLEAMLGEAQVLDDLGIEEADGVAGSRVAKAGVEFFGDGGAAHDRTSLEDADREPGFRQVTGAGQAVVTAANDDRIKSLRGA